MKLADLRITNENTIVITQASWWMVGNGNATNGSTVVKGAWANGGKGLTNRYLGLKFLIKGQTHYGWARLNVKLHPLLGTLTGYAYETVANKAIVAGKTKGAEVIAMPASLGELAHGARA